MRKIVKRIGNSIGIIFDVEDKEIYDLDIGKVIEFDIKDVKDLERLKKELKNKK